MSRRPFVPPSRRERQSTELPTSVESVEVKLIPSTQSIAVDEVLGLEIRLLRSMPLPSTLVCSFAREGGQVVLASHPPSSAPGGPPVPTFSGPEVDAMALAAEHGRALAATMRAWCAKKPDWRLTSVEAIGKLGFKPEPLGWTTAQVLRALGLQLDEVRL